MEYFFIVLTLALVLWFVFCTFTAPSVWFHTTFLGYKKVLIKSTSGFSPDDTIAVTKDGKVAIKTPQFKDLWNFDLYEDGSAKMHNLNFKHATWEYV